ASCRTSWSVGARCTDRWRLGKRSHHQGVFDYCPLETEGRCLRGVSRGRATADQSARIWPFLARRAHGMKLANLERRFGCLVSVARKARTGYWADTERAAVLRRCVPSRGPLSRLRSLDRGFWGWCPLGIETRLEAWIFGWLPAARYP